MIQNDSFKKNLTETVHVALTDLLNKTQNESIYAISLYTSGEDDFSTEVSAIKLPKDPDPKRDTKLYNIFVSCLKTIQKKQVLKKLDVAYLITCGDMSDEFLLKGIKKLNSEEFVDKYIEEYTQIPFINYLKLLPESNRVETVIKLFKDLSLNINTDLSIEAKSRNVDHFDLKPIIAKFGYTVVPRLLDIIEENGFKQIFYGRSSVECKKYGVCTLENNLSTLSAFLIEDCGRISDSDTARIQALIKNLVEHQSSLVIKSTLPENLARVLNHLKPNNFPKTIMNPKTNFLENYNEYIL
ncbi:MAG: hypothetical protein ACOCUV_01690 [bacterium]